MRVKDIENLLKESDLSPEELGPQIGVSGMTVRRWTLQDSGTEIAPIYGLAVREVIFKMIAGGRLNSDSASARYAVRENEHSAQKASMRDLVGSDQETDQESHGFEDRVLTYLSRVGQQDGRLGAIREKKTDFGKYLRLGKTWKENVGLLWKTIEAPRIAMLEKTVAIGALFYLLQAFDLIPDALPLVGYIDDFAFLTVASTYCANRMRAEQASTTKPERDA